MTLNEHCFEGAERERWLLIAGGMRPRYQPVQGHSGFEPEMNGTGMVIRSGGMSMPFEYKLPLGQYYYRFMGAVAHNVGVAAVGGAAFFGNWWIDGQTLASIRQHGRTLGDLSAAAKYFLALPYEWGDHGRVVRALLLKPLRAWRGKGLPAPDAVSGTRFIPPQHVEVAQLFIPGSRDALRQAFDRAECRYARDAESWFR